MDDKTPGQVGYEAYCEGLMKYSYGRSPVSWDETPEANKKSWEEAASAVIRVDRQVVLSWQTTTPTR